LVRRRIDIREDDELDAAQMTIWVKQSGELVVSRGDGAVDLQVTEQRREFEA
jgi:hypothetical protein